MQISEVRFPNTIPELLANDNQNVHTDILTREQNSCCLTLNIACSYFLSFLRRNLRLVDTFILDESDWLTVLRRHWSTRFARLFKSAKVGQKSFLSELDAPVLGQFLSDFVWVKSNVFPRLSNSTYPPYGTVIDHVY